MADTAPPNTPSVVERTRVIAAGAPVVAAHFLGRTAALVLGEEAVLLVPDKGDEQRLTLHGGGILSAATDGVSVITGGDDGKVFSTDAKGESRLIATDAKRRWIDHVAAGDDGDAVGRRRQDAAAVDRKALLVALVGDQQHRFLTKHEGCRAAKEVHGHHRGAGRDCARAFDDGGSVGSFSQDGFSPTSP